MNININVHHHINDAEYKQIRLMLSDINQTLILIMANIQDLTAQVVQLQADLDAEQQQIADALAALNAQITELKTMVADGGTAEQRQALADALTAISSDLQATIPEAPSA